MKGNKKDIISEKSSTEYIKNIRSVLLRYMNNSYLTIKELAERAQLPMSTLNKILYSDQTDCKLSTTIQLAKCLGISIEELTGADTINETVLNNVVTCRGLPMNSIYLIRWFINHQRTLYAQDTAANKKIISIQCPLQTNDGILKVNNNFRQVDISSLSEDYQSKVFFGLQIGCDIYMPNYSPFDILLLANDRTPLEREHIVVLIGNNLFIVKRKMYEGQICFCNIRTNSFICYEDDVDEVIGYVTYVISDSSETGDR